MRNWWLPVLALAIAGCTSGSGTYMPLKEGLAWSYESRSGLSGSVVDVSVSRQVVVGPDQGFELVSQAGASRMAWRGKSLLASQLAGTFYSPPVPVFALGSAGPVTWQGTVTFRGSSSSGTATLTVADTEAKAGSKSVPAKQSTLLVRSNGRESEVTTWFVQKIGIVRQEQREDGLLVNRLTYLSGPDGN